MSFGGNAHVDKQTPGSRRHEMNSLRMFEFGKQLKTTPFLELVSISSYFIINILLVAAD